MNSNDATTVRAFTGVHKLIIAPTVRHSEEFEATLLKPISYEAKESAFYKASDSRRKSLMLLAGMIEMDNERYEVIELDENFVFQADVYGVSGVGVSTLLEVDKFSKHLSETFDQSTGRGKPSETVFDNGTSSIKTASYSFDLVVHDMASKTRFIAGVLQIDGEYTPN